MSKLYGIQIYFKSTTLQQKVLYFFSIFFKINKEINKKKRKKGGLPFNI